MVAHAPRFFNVANNITLARLVLTVGFLVLVGVPRRWTYGLGLILFLVASAGDILDGYLARRHGVTSDIGRVGDPLVDKVLICGGFIMLLGTGEFPALKHWMVLAIVLRELLVTTLRGLSEARGVPFMATLWGKAKMFLQSVALGVLVCGYALGVILEPWGRAVQLLALYSAVIATIISGLYYLDRACRLLRPGWEGGPRQP
jgi:CDP-diacylglycerol--glycerol-3-phosphate 3-phosphatidyltransferase